MAMHRAAFGVLAVAGVVTAGSVTYLAVRTAPPAPGTTPVLSVADSVTETENLIAPAESPAAPAPRPSAPTKSDLGEASRAERATAKTIPRGRAEEMNRSSVGSSNEGDRPAPLPSSAESHRPADPPLAPPIQPAAEAMVVKAPPLPAPPPQPQFEDLVIPADSVIGLQLDTAVTSERAKVEDRVQARVTRDVKVGDRVVIAAGSRAEGAITLVEPGGRLKDRARLGIRFRSVVLADGTKVALDTETIYREGESPSRESAAKIGGAAVGGAVLGAILGGKKGAVLGGTVGAAGGTAAVMAGEPNAATLPAGATLTARIASPITVTVEK